MILRRFKRTKNSVFGIITSEYFGTYFTLENVKTLIPAGEYDVLLTYSPKFYAKRPLVFNKEVLPSRAIRIHEGNSVKDSQGCILIGNSCTLSTGLRLSKPAIEQLVRSLKDHQETATLTIMNIYV